jgi:hypothetical protein
MRSFFGRLFLMLAITALVAPRVPAQFGKKNNAPALRDVQGVVTDADGKPAPGAIVQLTNTKTQQIISFITKEQGDYYFHGLSPDIDFQLFAEREGKSSVTRTLSSFDNRKQAIMNLKLDRDKKQ